MPRVAPARNRLHAVLLKSDPAAEPAAYLSSAWQLAAMAECAGATGLAAAGRRRYCTLCAKHGACARARDAFWKLSILFPSSSFHPDAKDMLASSLAREILAADSERAKLFSKLGRLPQDDKTYRCLLTILGIGPQSASVLATSIDTSLFQGDSKLAAYCGLTPADHDCRSSIKSQKSVRKGNKVLKILLIFSCNSLVGTKRCFGKHYDACVARGMRHSKALKALARKRLRVIYAMMRDGVPYVEPPAEDVEKSPATT
jgi:transposase